MNKINIGIYDEHVLVQEGIKTLLSERDDLKIVLSSAEKGHLLQSLKTSLLHILIINIHDLSISIINLIVQLNINHPKIKMLIFSANNSEELILKIVKAGAKGFLGKDSDKNELIEAIYTLRNGHDYYSKSITHLLLNKYITNLKSEDKSQGVDISVLSSREVEILKLWGNSNSNKDIAEKLFISVRTVESHKNHIMQKLSLKTTIDLVKFAIKNNIIEI